MAANQSRCPSLGVLEGLLAERLSGPERDGVESHVEGCASCQEELSRLSGSTFFPTAALKGGSKVRTTNGLATRTPRSGCPLTRASSAST